MESAIRKIKFAPGRTFTASAMEKSWKLYEPRARWNDKRVHKVSDEHVHVHAEISMDILHA